MQERLLELLKTLSYKPGEVILSSGLKSDFYIDCRQTALNAEGCVLIGKAVYWHAHQLGVVGIGGMTLGADPIVTAASFYSQTVSNPMHAFIVRKEPKVHGTQLYLEGRANFKTGDRVLIVEDVVTTGASTLRAIDRVIGSGLIPVGVWCLVDRQEGGRQQMELSLPFYSVFTKSDFK